MLQIIVARSLTRIPFEDLCTCRPGREMEEAPHSGANAYLYPIFERIRGSGMQYTRGNRRYYSWPPFSRGPPVTVPAGNARKTGLQPLRTLNAAFGQAWNFEYVQASTSRTVGRGGLRRWSTRVTSACHPINERTVSAAALPDLHIHRVFQTCIYWYISMHT